MLYLYCYYYQVKCGFTTFWNIHLIFYTLFLYFGSFFVLSSVIELDRLEQALLPLYGGSSTTNNMSYAGVLVVVFIYFMI